MAVGMGVQATRRLAWFRVAVATAAALSQVELRLTAFNLPLHGSGRASRGGCRLGSPATSRDRQRVALGAKLPPSLLDEDAVWDPMESLGMEPEPFQKGTSTYTAETALPLYLEPHIMSPPFPDRIIQKGTIFSAEEMVLAGELQGVDVWFLKPKKASMFEGPRAWAANTQLYERLKQNDYGEGGWICMRGLIKNGWFMKHVVKRLKLT
mmetsp:Transcript_12899/g.30198  ORF Transcript_12899/g.30198 Transcript_12899/m.30198 type:complete len:209 (+) Transcript_12899:67-693(+)